MRRETRVAKSHGCAAPWQVWNKSFETPPLQLGNARLRLTAFDEDILSADDTLGQVEVQLGRNGAIVAEIPLDATGENAMALQRSKLNKTDDEIKGRLHFVVAEAEGGGDVDVHVKMTSLRSVDDTLVVFRLRLQETEHWKTAAHDPMAIKAAEKGHAASV